MRYGPVPTCCVVLAWDPPPPYECLGIPPNWFARPGTTCKLADRACPRAGRLGGPLGSLGWSVPSDMIDSDLWCLCACAGELLPLGRPALCSAGERRSSAIEGVLRDKAGRWPRRCGGGGAPCCCELRLVWRDTDGRVDDCTGGSLRWRSGPGANLGGLGLCVFVRCGAATFLKVMVHSTSSPANTVESFHCTKTRMLEGVDMVRMAEGAGRGRGDAL